MQSKEDEFVYSKPGHTSSTLKRYAVNAVYWLALGATALYAASSYLDKPANADEIFSVQKQTASQCPSGAKLVPPKDSQFSDLSYFRSQQYKWHSLDVWRAAVQIYTPSFDDLGPVGRDRRWNVFYRYEKYLTNTFRHIAKTAELVHVNTHGLVFIIHGTDESLKPVVLMGHQDVVPVPEETVSRWKYNPFRGYFDGQWLWGRGAGDNKNDHIALLEGVDKLLSQGFKPKRGIIIALGFDEESDGKYGAKEISTYLEKRFGQNSVYFIVDEGGMGIQDKYGARFALPATGEKGYVDVTIDLMTTGGHSSVPPRHTAIGIVSELVALIEQKPYPLDLTEKNPFYTELHCMASKGPLMPKSLKRSILKMDSSKSAKKYVLEELDKDISVRYLASTSQAVDIIYGGLKINALPEKVTVRVNHRVGYDSSVAEVKNTILANVKTIAKKYRLGVQAFDSAVPLADWPVDIPAGNFVLSTVDELSPAPQSPTSGPTWKLLAGTIKHVFEDFAVFPDADPKTDKEVNVSPAIMTGNTDTKYMWDLTKNIYRFSAARTGRKLNAHAIDERVDIDAHVECVAFYYALLRNVYEDDRKNGTVLFVNQY